MKFLSDHVAGCKALTKFSKTALPSAVAGNTDGQKAERERERERESERERANQLTV